MSIVDVISSKIHDWVWNIMDVKDSSPEIPEKLVITEKNSNPQDQQQDECKKVALPLKYQIDESVEQTSVVSRDGINLNVRIIRGQVGPSNNGKGKVMLLASPLGFSNMYVFRPLIHHFGSEYTYINWDYRGVFKSDNPKRMRKISIRDQAEDAYDVLAGLGYEYADVMVGHSMGVSVACEFTLLYPERVNSLILVNGGHGHVFSTAFQPITRIPFVGNVSEFIVKTLLRNNPRRTMEVLKVVLTSKPIDKLLTMVGRFTGTKRMLEVQGEEFWCEWIQMYFGGLASDEKSAEGYCRLFQELHAHSTYHLLDLIEHPALLISGRLDYLTPSYLMKEMAKEMKNAEHHSDWFSTHLTLMENPEFVLERADKFLKDLEDGKKVERTSSVAFRPAQATLEH